MPYFIHLLVEGTCNKNDVPYFTNLLVEETCNTGNEVKR